MSEHTSITERTRSRVDGILERLREEYGTFEVVEKTWERSPSELARIKTQFEQDRLDGAGVWLTDSDYCDCVPVRLHALLRSLR